MKELTQKKPAADASAPAKKESKKGSNEKAALKGMTFAEGESALSPKGAEAKPAAKKKDGLALGDEGPEVIALQKQLKRMAKDAEVDQDFKAEFNPGKIDGKFGPSVERAVRALQSLCNVSLTGVFDAATASLLAKQIAFLDDPNSWESGPEAKE